MSNEEKKYNTPLLDQLIEKKSGFSIPEDYFENVESSILLQIKKSELASNPFNTPQNYFENVDSRILAQIKDTKSNTIFTLNRFWIPISIAAMLILNFGIFTFQKQEQSFEMADMENWLENRINSTLPNNIIVNPMDNYTHNRYINKLREKEGIQWGK